MATVNGQLKHGVKIGESVLKDFTMRSAKAGDLFRAENMLPKEHGEIAFRGALIACLVTKLGDVDGPLELKLIEDLSIDDFTILNEKRLELEKLGE